MATLSGAPVPTGAIDALTFDPAGPLFGANLTDLRPGNPGRPPDAAFLVLVNPTTGAVTDLGPSVPGLDALAIQGSVVPEPSSLTLLALGAAALAGWQAWRKRWARAAATA